MNTVWLSCEGEKPADRENIGPIEYIPRRGFPGYFYPYKNTAGYMSPLVAVYFKQPHSKYLAFDFSYFIKESYHVTKVLADQ